MPIVNQPTHRLLGHAVSGSENGVFLALTVSPVNKTDQIDVVMAMTNVEAASFAQSILDIVEKASVATSETPSARNAPKAII